MQLDLTRFRQPLSHVSRRFTPAEVDPEGGESYRVVAPVELDFDLHKDKARFRVVGRARAELELQCSRCLEPYRLPVDAPFVVTQRDQLAELATLCEAVRDGELGTEDAVRRSPFPAGTTRDALACVRSR